MALPGNELRRNQVPLISVHAHQWGGEEALGVDLSLRLATVLNSPKKEAPDTKGGGVGVLNNDGGKKTQPKTVDHRIVNHI